MRSIRRGEKEISITICFGHIVATVPLQPTTWRPHLSTLILDSQQN